MNQIHDEQQNISTIDDQDFTYYNLISALHD